MEKFSFLQFVAADCGNKEAAHEYRMAVIMQQIITGVKGNDSDWRKAMEVAKAQKTAIAKAYVRGFTAIGRIAPAKYQGRCTEEIMQTVILPKAQELCEQFEITFLSALPVRKEIDKEAAKAIREEKKQAEFLKMAEEQGFVSSSTLSAANAFQIVQAALPHLAKTELVRLQSMVDAMVQVSGIDVASAKEAINADAEA